MTFSVPSPSSCPLLDFAGLFPESVFFAVFSLFFCRFSLFEFPESVLFAVFFAVLLRFFPEHVVPLRFND